MQASEHSEHSEQSADVDVVEQVFSRLDMTHPTEEDRAMMAQTIRHKTQIGWTVSEIAAHMRNSEEVNPELDEATALARMGRVASEVAARLHGGDTPATAPQSTIGVAPQALPQALPKALPPTASFKAKLFDLIECADRVFCNGIEARRLPGEPDECDLVHLGCDVPLRHAPMDFYFDNEEVIVADGKCVVEECYPTDSEEDRPPRMVNLEFRMSRVMAAEDIPANALATSA